MTPEQIEGYLNRLHLMYRHDEEFGNNGVFAVHFATRMYRSTFAPHAKRIQLMVALSDEGRLLTVLAPYIYQVQVAKNPAAFYQYLIELNFRCRCAHFQVDRRDGEVSCTASVPLDDSNLSLAAFRKLIYAVPLAVDFHHRMTKAVLKTGVLPPPPKGLKLDMGLLDVMRRVGGSVAKLQEIVDAHERRAAHESETTRSPAAEPTGTSDATGIQLNPLPPVEDVRGDMPSDEPPADLAADETAPK